MTATIIRLSDRRCVTAPRLVQPTTTPAEDLSYAWDQCQREQEMRQSWQRVFEADARPCDQEPA